MPSLVCKISAVLSRGKRRSVLAALTDVNCFQIAVCMKLRTQFRKSAFWMVALKRRGNNSPYARYSTWRWKKLSIEKLNGSCVDLSALMIRQKLRFV